jgi:hypothetical protein
MGEAYRLAGGGPLTHQKKFRDYRIDVKRLEATPTQLNDKQDASMMG